MTAPPTDRNRIFVSRRLRFVALVALVVVMITALRPWWSPAATRRAVLKSDTPSAETVEELVGSVEDPIRFVEELWKTEKIPQRQYAINAIASHAKTWDQARLQSLVLEALLDPNLNVRERAISVLDVDANPQCDQALVNLLADTDPEVRQMVLFRLRRRPKSEYASVAIELLRTPNSPLSQSAASLLRRLTGLDFGIRIRADSNTIVDGIAKWQQWWSDNRGHFPSNLSVPASPLSLTELSARDFRLRDLSGRPVRLSEFAGRKVLLNFWATWCPPCQYEIPDLIRLQSDYGKELVVLGISADAAPHHHTHGHDDHHDGGTEDVHEKVSRFAETYGINYRIMIDESGDVLNHYMSTQLPTTVLIDTRGNIRRRFTGIRTPTVLRTMVDELP